MRMTKRRLALIAAPIVLIGLVALAPGRSIMLGYDFTGFRGETRATEGSRLARAETPADAPALVSLAYLIDDLLREPTVLRSAAEPSPRLAYERVL